MHVFVVAIEYRGEDIPDFGDVARVAICEHAFDLLSATLAGHGAGERPRVAFPAPRRAWNTEPRAHRCAACTAAVDAIVRDLVTDTLSALAGRRAFDELPNRYGDR
jgi:hypothetical protein